MFFLLPRNRRSDQPRGGVAIVQPVADTVLLIGVTV
jgi:hypothetical protein